MAIDFLHEPSVPRVRQVAHLQQAQLGHLLRALAKQSAELDRFRGRAGDLQERLEGLEAEVQGTLAKAGEEAEDDSAETSKPNGGRDESGATKPAKPGHGPKDQPALERETRLFELDLPDKTCPQCGGDLEPMADQAETSEMVDVVEVRYVLVQVRQQKYRCQCGGCVETAIGPDRAVEGGRYSLEFAIKVAIDKYLDHLPLERQVRIMSRHGLEVTSQTLWDQIFSLAVLLEPAWKALRDHILSKRVIGLDQTGWPNLGRKGSKPWQMWALTSTDAVWHTIRDDKSAATFTDLVGKYVGTIVCDALGTHGAGAREGPGIQLAGCWAHVLRKFRDAAPDFPEAGEMLGLIGELYDIEDRATSEDERLRLRQAESREVLARMKAWLGTVAVPSSTTLGEAARYTMKFWDRLVRFVDDAEIWLDDNRTERGLRGPVLGRRNHHGSKSRRGTHVAAVLYSLVETAKLAGVDPETYLLEAAKQARLSPKNPLLPWDLAATLEFNSK